MKPSPDKRSDDRDSETVPKNPTNEELKSSLKDAKFPVAAQMARDALGETPKSETHED